MAEPEDIRRDVEELWSFHQRRLRADIPAEHLRDRIAFSQAPPFRLVACADCGLVYRNPTEREHEVVESYVGDVPPADRLRELHAAQFPSYREQAARLAALLPQGATVLEVGSYVGAFLAAARDAGLRAVGVDVNPTINQFTRSLGFQVHDGELADAPPDSVDAVVIWNAFDQMVDPRGTLTAARSRLKPDGHLALRVPNGSFYRRWSRRRAGRWLLAHNNLLGFPYRWGFNPRAMTSLCETLGFRVSRTVGDVLVPTSDRWTRAWAKGEERAAKAALRLAWRGRVDAAPWFETYAAAAEWVA
ncbi:MAG TPA: class I SAM-dependent methyltransferase [Gemmatimonadaceae bacterium]